MTPLVKQPAEAGTWVIPFQDLLPVGAVLASVVSVEQTPQGHTPNAADLLLTAPKVRGTDVRIDIEGGTDGEVYVLRAVAADESGNTYEADVELVVMDHGAWTPSGAGGYVSPADYVIRFGYSETTQLTDLYRQGRINMDVLGRALLDADAKINGYLQTRFKLPLNSVPRLLEQMAGDIARYYLHTDNVSEVVEARYKDACASLAKIAKGDMELGLDAEDSPAPEPGLPAFSAPPRVFSRENLEGY